MTAPSTDPPPQPAPLVRLVLELGPLAVFFIAFQVFKGDDSTRGILMATAFMIPALLASNAVSYWLTGALSRITLVTTVIVVVLGGLTLFLQDATFIKMRPTLVNASFSLALTIGLLLGQNYLKYLMSELMPMDDVGWSKLARNWAIYFACMAVLNEIVWRTQTEETWVWAKTFLYLPITLAFTISQTPIMTRHALDQEAGDEADPAASPSSDRDRL